MRVASHNRGLVKLFVFLENKKTVKTECEIGTI